MKIVESLHTAGRELLWKYPSIGRGLRRLPIPWGPRMSSLTLTSGQNITLAHQEVHISDSGSRTFHYRPNSVGDVGVMKQIFEQNDYALHHWPQGKDIIDLLGLLNKKQHLSLIMDMGANIGASSVFFCESYPGAKLICVEPDPSNADILIKNMVGLKYSLFRGAISNRRGQLSLLDPGHGDWGFRTAPLGLQDGASKCIEAETVQNLLARFGENGIPVIAKIDIEGGESDLFSDACEWMDMFPCVIIELHDWMLPSKGTSRNFLKQVAARELDFVHRGENIFIFNTTLTRKLINEYGHPSPSESALAKAF